MNSAIIIPARYGSTRFPGKPLANIAGKTMLERVVDIARSAVDQIGYVRIIVATEDERIFKHAQKLEVTAMMTSDDCTTGSDRVLEAAQKLSEDVEFVFGLQGDAPFTPVEALVKMSEAVENNQDIEVVTPIVPLRWDELATLRKNKEQTPFSGTTVTTNKEGRALWFSKNIIPAIRKEDDLKAEEFSPVYQHIGLYGYKIQTLEKFVSLPQGHYEKLEGLEQLRLLENDIPIHTVKIEMENGLMQSGIDSPEDVERAEEVIKKYNL
ncbi:MAG: 3-deoxy-manno-octulosonate cytidylyltransferase [Pseudomonadota bacterium]